MAYYLSTLNPLTWNNHISAKRNIWALYVHKIVQITSTGLLENIPISAFKAFLQTEHSFLKSVFDVSNLDFISVFPELLPFFFSSEYRVILFVTLLPQRVMVSAVKSSAQLMQQLMELLFTSQAIGHCKTTPTLQHGFLVQVKAYSNLRVWVLLLIGDCLSSLK